jgi:hypothetical protein
MTQQNQSIHLANAAKRMVVGGAIALVLIAFFVFTVDNPKPEWGKLWVVRPLIITPLAGAMGGLVYHYMVSWGNEGGWKKTLATIFGVIAYIIALWLGTVLGLDGTLWN